MEAHRSALPRPELIQPIAGDSVPHTHTIVTFKSTPQGRSAFRQSSIGLPSHNRWTCWICGHAVSLETCKTDEHGEAVHEECYVARLALENASARRVAQSEQARQEAASAGH
jgi:hypothetical protein